MAINREKLIEFVRSPAGIKIEETLNDIIKYMESMINDLPSEEIKKTANRGWHPLTVFEQQATSLLQVDGYNVSFKGWYNEMNEDGFFQTPEESVHAFRVTVESPDGTTTSIHRHLTNDEQNRLRRAFERRSNALDKEVKQEVMFDKLTNITQNIEEYVKSLESWELCGSNALGALANKIAYELDDDGHNGYIDCKFMYSDPSRTMDYLCAINIQELGKVQETVFGIDMETRKKLAIACEERDAIYQKDAIEAEKHLVSESPYLRVFQTQGDNSCSNFYYSKEQNRVVPATLTYDQDSGKITFAFAHIQDDFQEMYERNMIREMNIVLNSLGWGQISRRDNVATSPEGQRMTENDFTCVKATLEAKLALNYIAKNMENTINELTEDELTNEYPSSAFAHKINCQLQELFKNDDAQVIFHYILNDDINNEMNFDKTLTEEEYCRFVDGFAIEVNDSNGFATTIEYYFTSDERVEFYCTCKDIEEDFQANVGRDGQDEIIIDDDEPTA